MDSFQEISRLLDRRLYRHRRLYWALAAWERDGALPDDAMERMIAYQQVVADWNDGINRTLALVEHYFTKDLRNRLDGQIGDGSVRLGRFQESAWRAASGASTTAPQSIDLKAQAELIAALSSMVYGYNLAMLRAGRL